tara:strand:+ start:1656 stop:2327 length:672 start_codon:yes stop_codon:yes gene_type:complete
LNLKTNNAAKPGKKSSRRVPSSDPGADFADAMIASSSLSEVDPPNAVTPVDDGLTVEEREDALLRKMGLDRFEERTDKSGRSFEKKLRADGKEDLTTVPGMNLPKGAFNEEGYFNPLSFIPIELQGQIESFLYLATGSLLFLFVLAGIAITYDAFMISTKAPEPEIFSSFMKDFLGPNFTNLGLVFLACSATLGGFKVAQFQNPDVYYSEPTADDQGDRESPF